MYTSFHGKQSTKQQKVLVFFLWMFSHGSLHFNAKAKQKYVARFGNKNHSSAQWRKIENGISLCLKNRNKKRKCLYCLKNGDVKRIRKGFWILTHLKGTPTNPRENIYCYCNILKILTMMTCFGNLLRTSRTNWTKYSEYPFATSKQM